MEISNVIIYLIGFAGTGKYTIAQEITKLSNVKLVDNHLINNPVFSVIQKDNISPIPRDVWDRVEAIRDVVISTISNISPSNFSFVFTNELLEGKAEDIKIYNKIENLAKKRKSKFLPIRLVCEEEELCKRVTSDDRKNRHKLIDAKTTRKKIINEKVLFPSHPNLLTVDVTNIPPSESARDIIEKALKL